MIPLFYILRDIGVLGTYWAMILPQTAISLPFGIFFMRAFFSGLPYDLTDAAKIDGCNDIDVFRRIMLPLAGPAVARPGRLQLYGLLECLPAALDLPAVRQAPADHDGHDVLHHPLGRGLQHVDGRARLSS